MTSAHDLNLTSDLIMSAVGVPVTAQSGNVPPPQAVFSAENATSGVITNDVSVGPSMLQAVQQVPNSTQNQKNSSNSKGQNSAKVNNNQSSAAAGGMCDEKTVEYLRDLIEEKKTIENNNNGQNHEEIHEMGGGSGTNASAILGPKSIVLRLLDQGKTP